MLIKKHKETMLKVKSHEPTQNFQNTYLKSTYVFQQTNLQKSAN
jgi:hypothetical protein